jgi:hypothetical protein
MATPEPIAAGETKQMTIAALKSSSTPEAQLPEVAAGFNSLRAFELLQRAGKALASSSLVPQIYQNNVPNCIIALEMAQRIGASPLMVMQNLYIVYNRPAWSAKFLIACFNQCGRFSAVRYIWSGTRGKDDWGCQAWSIEKETNEKIFGPVITMELTKAEGWYGRKDSKWKTMPEKMFMYRAAAWMIDTHAPELSMGIRTDDEARDTYDATRAADGSYSVTTESLRQAEQQTIEHAQVSSDAPKQNEPPKATPQPAWWATTIAGQTTSPDLEKIWQGCLEAFGEDGVPDECDAAYQNRKEALGEQAGKALEEKGSAPATGKGGKQLDL